MSLGVFAYNQLIA